MSISWLMLSLVNGDVLLLLLDHSARKSLCFPFHPPLAWQEDQAKGR
jgi:hypothetical protein